MGEFGGVFFEIGLDFFGWEPVVFSGKNFGNIAASFIETVPGFEEPEAHLAERFVVLDSRRDDDVEGVLHGGFSCVIADGRGLKRDLDGVSLKVGIGRVGGAPGGFLGEFGTSEAEEEVRDVADGASGVGVADAVDGDDGDAVSCFFWNRVHGMAAMVGVF